MKSNIIPKSYADVINLALQALAGALGHGAAINLQHNTAAHLNAELHDVTGDPAHPETTGKQGLLDAQLRAMATAQAALDVVLEAARKFCHTGMGVLKPLLGHRWNGEWLTAGFATRSLSVPRVPLNLLIELRGYLIAHSSFESASLGFTAADAQGHIDAICAATQARDMAKGARWSVKAARDQAFRALRKRLGNLRAELAQLLAPTDGRWYAFGFRRPADGRQPAAVEDVTVTELGNDAVHVTWAAAPRAELYHVALATSNEEREERATADTSCTFTHVPPHVPFIIAVTARNAAGETRATEVRLRDRPALTHDESALHGATLRPLD